jgi:hypothetical protein
MKLGMDALAASTQENRCEQSRHIQQQTRGPTCLGIALDCPRRDGQPHVDFLGLWDHEGVGWLAEHAHINSPPAMTRD